MAPHHGATDSKTIKSNPEAQISTFSLILNLNPMASGSKKKNPSDIRAKKSRIFYKKTQGHLFFQ